MRGFVNRSGRVRVACAAVLVALSIMLWTPTTAVAQPSGLKERNGAATATATDTQLSFGQWTLFTFGGPGSFNFEGAFTFWSRHPVLLRVTDGFCRGDRFRVHDRGFPIFLTSRVAIDPSCDDIPLVGLPSVAWFDQTYSKGAFLLQPGFHRVRIQAMASPFGGGAAWLWARPIPVG
jgi:hypothetical protein